MPKKIRVRFAPSPTGFMHLGNIRAALLNYIFSRQSKGIFVLRIEDTDSLRNIDEAGYEIITDLKWLGLNFDEGPVTGGKYGPYIQSRRIEIYKKNLSDLIENQKVYRCFCSEQELEEMKKEQIKNRKPPRYDKRCRLLSDDQIKEKLFQKKPFIWRFKVNELEKVQIYDMARGQISFEMKNFSDFALTRPDGSFTFMFANFVDDWLMNITHVIRGEDHLTNSAMQAALFESFAVTLPTFWHLPMICNIDGKKLSKRDFGFSLEDLQNEGFLKEAILNYLAIVGVSFDNEIQSLDELIKNYDFSDIHSTGAIKYDIDKLLWINHKWLLKLNVKELIERLRPFLQKNFSEINSVDEKKLEELVDKVRGDVKTLNELSKELGFCFKNPFVDKVRLEQEFGLDLMNKIKNLVYKNLNLIVDSEKFLDQLKFDAKNEGINKKDLFMFIRYLLTGKFSGIGIKNLFEMLDSKVIKERLS